MNKARGYLAELPVARGLGSIDLQRFEWADHDVLLVYIRIEVRNSAYLQAWERRC